MTTLELQDDIAKEIENILRPMLFKNPEGDLVNISAYTQSLPKRKQTVQLGNIMAAGDGEDPYPFCVVKVDSGRMETAQSTHEVRIVMVFGIFDDDTSCQGHRAILNIIQKITERFTKDPVLKNKYRMNYDEGITWTLDEEDRYPYYFGAMEIVWDTAMVRREEDRFA